MPLHASWVHGNALTVEDPSALERDGHNGWGRDLAFVPGKASWLHIPLPTPVIVAESVSSADSGTQMRVNGGGYIYNFSTKTLTAGQDYTIRIRVGSTTGTIIAKALFQPKK